MFYIDDMSVLCVKASKPWGGGLWCLVCYMSFYFLMQCV